YRCRDAQGQPASDRSGRSRPDRTGVQPALRQAFRRRARMIPVGYMAKRVVSRPEWLKAPAVVDIFSVSSGMSPDFADYITFWKHNGYWVFDSPDIIRQLADEKSIDLMGTTLFYYEVYELEFDDAENKWRPFYPEPSFTTNVIAPARKNLEGYDVVTFCMG